MRCLCVLALAVSVLGCAARADDAEGAAIKWVESVGGKFTRDDAAPGKPVNGVNFGAANKKVTNDGLKELKALKNLKTLVVFFSEQIGDEGAKHIGQLNALEKLTLGNTSVTDAGVAELKGLKNLKSLTLSGNIRMTDTSADTIKNFVALEELSLPSTFTDDGVKKLVGVKKLKTLYIGGARLTDAAVSAIALNMPDLEHLELGTPSGTDITDAVVADLVKLTKLKRLGLSGSKLTESGVKVLREKLPDCTITRK